MGDDTFLKNLESSSRRNPLDERSTEPVAMTTLDGGLCLTVDVFGLNDDNGILAGPKDMTSSSPLPLFHPLQRKDLIPFVSCFLAQRKAHHG